MYYQHLFLEIRADQESEELELVIVERYVSMPNELFLEFHGKNSRAIHKIQGTN